MGGHMTMAKGHGKKVQLKHLNSLNCAPIVHPISKTESYTQIASIKHRPISCYGDNNPSLSPFLGATELTILI